MEPKKLKLKKEIVLHLTQKRNTMGGIDTATVTQTDKPTEFSQCCSFGSYCLCPPSQDCGTTQYYTTGGNVQHPCVGPAPKETEACAIMNTTDCIDSNTCNQTTACIL